jgi:hypothetical protein
MSGRTCRAFVTSLDRVGESVGIDRHLLLQISA